ncbi:hypothetical protein [Tenacibaculum jejuense]|uniref:Uncharacterized protein n=1 Tax=Tenacibaculum jejuense TaxID=584609 RepID=A0A238U4L8_9FLAO|nr:hypothetical protein [Tenacibaculum jejuense]SNR14149.1 membrane protein of unknown function [Tenacibaculum jejuense]
MKKILFVCFFILQIKNAYGCSCSRDQINQEEYDKYTLIFLGKIIQVEDCDNEGYQEFTFEIEELFKGQTTTFVSGFNNCGGVCNYGYKIGQKWLVFSNPEYGLINDQHACNASLIVAHEENETLIGKDDYLSLKDWEFEITFLNSRKTKDVKIVSFQFVQVIPILKEVIILGFFFFIFFFSIKFKLKLVLYSFGFGSIAGVSYYSVLISNFPEPINYVLIISLIMLFLLIASAIYYIGTKEKLIFKTSLIFNFITYATFIITTIFMIVLNRHQSITYNTSFFTILLMVLGVGIFFSLFVSSFVELFKRIKQHN